jgi:Tfp pilus assembly protein PilZ
MGASAPRPIRRHRRRTVRVEIELAGPFGARRALATTLGAGGLFVETDQPLDAGATLEVAFQLVGDTCPRRIAARVVWTLPPEEAGPHRAGMGLAFTDPAAVAALAHALERDDPIPSG